MNEVRAKHLDSIVRIMAEIGDDEFRPGRLADLIDSTYRTARDRCTELCEMGYLVECDGNRFYRLSRNADYSILEKSFEFFSRFFRNSFGTDFDARAQPSEEQSSSSGSFSTGIKATAPACGSNSQKNSDGDKPTTTNTTDTVNPVEAARREIDGNTDVDTNTDWDEMSELQKIQQHLRTCGFKANSQTANKIYRTGLVQNEIDESEVLGFAITHINALSGKVESGEMSRSKAQRCLGNNIGIQLYLNSKSVGKDTDTDTNDDYTDPSGFNDDYSELREAMFGGDQ